MKKHTIDIVGMSCGHCVQAVQRALRAVDGVQEVRVQIGQAEIEADDAVQRATLVDAIEDQGFDVP